MAVKCVHEAICKYKANSHLCRSCVNNQLRNKEEDLYKKADDNPIPNECPKLSYDGPAEQTSGYKCPVCNGFTNPYTIRDNRCGHCGYLLNV
jgi:hypothetical protein